MSNKWFALYSVLAFIVVCSIIVMCFNEKEEDNVVYIPGTWAGAAGFTTDNLYIPHYGESGMLIRDNVNVNLDKITIAIEELNKRVKELEGQR